MGSEYMYKYIVLVSCMYFVCALFTMVHGALSENTGSTYKGNCSSGKKPKSTNHIQPVELSTLCFALYTCAQFVDISDGSTSIDLKLLFTEIT